MEESNLLRQALLPEAYLELYPPGIRQAAVDGIEGFMLGATQLGIEVMRAERDGHTYADACQRSGDFPLMTRLHNGIIDLIQSQVSSTDRATIRAGFADPRSAQQEHLHSLYFAVANAKERRPEPALFRFVIYQYLRLKAWAAAWEPDGTILDLSGVSHEMNVEIEGQLREQCREQEVNDGDARPFKEVFAELLDTIKQAWNDNQEQIRADSAGVVDYISRQLAQFRQPWCCRVASFDGEPDNLTDA